jgi:hypothetical protein
MCNNICNYFANLPGAFADAVAFTVCCNEAVPLYTYDAPNNCRPIICWNFAEFDFSKCPYSCTIDHEMSRVRNSVCRCKGGGPCGGDSPNCGFDDTLEEPRHLQDCAAYTANQNCMNGSDNSIMDCGSCHTPDCVSTRVFNACMIFFTCSGLGDAQAAELCQF